ncbi:MAG: hypothetical protein LBJ25_01930, partial [Candidatus Margulisbacteria bacterium]|nr:hypothetical protein [Candidatus Margulisiibacteriota bacterium]
MARYKYRTPDSTAEEPLTGAGATPTTNVGLADTAEKKRQNYLSNKEAYAADYNQTLENLKKEHEHRIAPELSGTNDVQAAAREVAVVAQAALAAVSNVMSGVTRINASQLTALRAATQGLVNYNGGNTFPWGENITALATRLRARHLEEIRQVIDDALNNARCVGGCTSVCGRGCGNDCVADCTAGCGAATCSSSCGVACATTCGDGCKDVCGVAC